MPTRRAKNTKATACRLTGRKPTRKQYERLQASTEVLLQTDAVPEFPHKLPPYNGPCFRQAANERMAYERMCQRERDYQAAVAEYNLLWAATEDCLHGAPA